MAFVACDSNSLVELDEQDVAAANLIPGIHQRTVALSDGGVLRYTVSVPQLSSGVRAPLVVALHGGGAVYPFVSQDFLTDLVEPGLRDLKSIIVAPDIPTGSWIDPLSEEIVMEFIRLIKHFERSWPINPDRIVVTGYSAGGIGAWYLTVEHPDVFSAGIQIAAEPIVGDRRGPDAVPMYVIHGELDEVFDVDVVRAAVQELESRDVPVWLVVEPNVSHIGRAFYREPLKVAVAWLEESVW